ncbi:MAG: nicotinamide mononucleotide transporter [Oscillospiraceae bacterium]|nr:nicotinamide mononucleotide transporter [Oscillospiraceae bacterium]
MSKIKNIFKILSPFQWASVIIVCGFTLYFALTDTESRWYYTLLSSLAAVCGIMNVVLCAKGKKAQYYWGLVNIASYIAISAMSRLYGEVMLNTFYYIPLQFIGLYMWRKNYSNISDSVKVRKMKTIPAIILIISTFIGICLYKYVLSVIGGNSVWLDSTSTVISIVANALMVLRYREQYLLWLVVNVVTTVMWALKGDPIMTTMWAVYAFNAVYGYYLWNKMSKDSENVSTVSEAV